MKYNILRIFSAGGWRRVRPAKLLFPLPSLIKSAVALVVPGATATQGAQTPGCHYLAGQKSSDPWPFPYNFVHQTKFFSLYVFFSLRIW